MNSIRAGALPLLLSCLALGCADPTSENQTVLSDVTRTPLTRPSAGDFTPYSLPAIFSPFDPPLVLELEVAPSDQLALESAPDEYVPARFAGPGDSAPIEVGLRIKGGIGSFRGCPFTCGDKSALKVDFNRVVRGQSWRGLESVNLNNQVQDPSLIHEWLAYELFRRQGVPAPRTGHVELRVNGESWGLYLMLEDRDDPFLDHHFPSTHALYEGDYRQDLVVGTTDTFEVDEGPDDGAAIAAFAAAIEQAPPGGIYAALAPIVDWNEVLAAMAVELFIGHWDGYAARPNNYHLHVDDDGKWSLLPWGTDQTFHSRLRLFEGVGILLQRCLEDDACVTAWSQALLNVAQDAKTLGHRQKAVDIAQQLQPYHDADPRRESSARNLVTLAHQTADFVDVRIAEVEKAARCQLDPASDLDGDGKKCTFDCNESDPTTYVGASEACVGGVADRIDNNCNGMVDEDVTCPPCVADGDYTYCRTRLPYAQAEATCAGLGSSLVTLNDEAEATRVHQGVWAHLGKAFYWIGLSDRVKENQFVWSDGTVLDRSAHGAFVKFGKGEPNNSQGVEDCVHVRDNNDTWNDLSCDLARSFVCERISSTPAPKQ